MKFILHEIKLWFKDENTEPISYNFIPNKINVITGDSTTGKTSFWNIIDYCLLSDKINIASTIIDKVLWFGIRFTINENELSIVRSTPIKGVGSSEVVFNYGNFPHKLNNNKKLSEVRSILNTEFKITDSLKISNDKGKSLFKISFRHFLIFNSLTQTIIDAPETYFDTTLYGKEEFDKVLTSIFDFVIGINDIDGFKAIERLLEIELELTKIMNQEKSNANKVKHFERDMLSIVNKCREYNFIEYDSIIDNADDAVTVLQEIISLNIKFADNTNLFFDLDKLNKEKKDLQLHINSIDQYEREYKTYKNNLKKAADSLQPIEFLNTKLSEQLIDSYETKSFVESLEISLKNIKLNLSRKIKEPVKAKGDIEKLEEKLKETNRRIIELEKIKNNQMVESNKLIALGEIKYAYENTLKKEGIKPIDKVQLQNLNEEKSNLEKVSTIPSQIKFQMITLLNQSIQRNYDKLTSLPTYKNYMTRFDDSDMVLKLYPPSNQLQFPLTNVGSASNYMFMHLCIYLGLHEHIINVEQLNTPRFLFIDQPSTPYYEGKNDDKAKLIDAFTLLNSFMEYIVETKSTNFQIFMVEHAPKEYWLENNLNYFHLVDEFVQGKGLIPKEIFNN